MNDFLIQNSFRSQWQLNLGFVYIASNDFLIQFLQFSILVKKRVFEQTPKKTPLFCLTFGSSSSFLFWPKPAGRPASFFPVFCNPQSFPNVFTEATRPAGGTGPDQPRPALTGPDQPRPAQKPTTTPKTQDRPRPAQTGPDRPRPAQTCPDRPRPAQKPTTTVIFKTYQKGPL